MASTSSHHLQVPSSSSTTTTTTKAPTKRTNQTLRSRSPPGSRGKPRSGRIKSKATTTAPKKRTVRQIVKERKWVILGVVGLLLALVFSAIRLASRSFEPDLVAALSASRKETPLFNSNEEEKESLEEELSRSAREELRRSWDLERAEQILASSSSAASSEGKEVEEEITEEEVERHPVPAARSMEELREAMREFSGDELAQMLNSAYRG